MDYTGNNGPYLMYSPLICFIYVITYFHIEAPVLGCEGPLSGLL